MDDELRRRAGAARAEIEAGVDVESELATRTTVTGLAAITPLPPGRRLVAVVGSIAAVAIAVVGGIVLFGGPDSIETAEPTQPSEPIISVGTTTSTLEPSTEPTTTFAGPTPTVVATTITTTPGANGGGASTTSTTDPTAAPGPTTTTTSTTTTSTTTTTVPAAAAVPWRSLPWEAERIERSCSGDVGCTELRIDADGSIVSYDPTTRTLTRHTTPAITTTVDDGLGQVYLELLGPDHVVYLNVDAATPGDGDADLLAMTLAPDDAGRVLGRWADVTDRVGDRDLVATRNGLVVVGCCDHAALRPAPDAEVLVRWVGRDGGGDTSISGPVMRTEVDAPTLTVHRDDDLPAGTRSWTFEPPADWQPRGMPNVFPTFDGGFIATTFGPEQSVIRGWVGGTIDIVTIDTVERLLLDPNGRVTIADGDRFARFEPFAERAEFWAGQLEFGDDGSIALPDIDSPIDGQADWARNPVAFANAVAGRLQVNERRAIDDVRASESEFRVEVTTSNFFDDSVSASRLELVLSRDDDGRFRFVSGQWGQVCQPGRGQQDFRPDLCN